MLQPEVANHPDTRVMNTVFATLNSLPGLRAYLVQCGLGLSRSWPRPVPQSRAGSSSSAAEPPAWVAQFEPVLRFFGEALQRLGPSHDFEQVRGWQGNRSWLGPHVSQRLDI